MAPNYSPPFREGLGEGLILMKKLLFLAVAVLFGISMQAQRLQKIQIKAQAPLHAASLDGTDMWGYTYDEKFGYACVGTGGTGEFGAAIKVVVDETMDGATIQGVAVPFFTTKATGVSVFVTKTLGGTDLASGTLSGSTKQGYNNIAFEEAYKMTKGETLYVGYKFTISTVSAQTEAYPIATGSDIVPGALNLLLGGEWQDYSSQFGASALQLLVKGLKLPDNKVAVSSIDALFGGMGEKATLNCNLLGNSGNAITSVGYTVELDGATVTGQASVKVASGVNKRGTLPIEITLPATAGSYKAKVTLTSVNGVAVTPETVSGDVMVLLRTAKRNTVIEEFTGTTCAWCPRGWAAMEYIKEFRPEVIGIAIHQYDSADPMYNNNYATLQWKGAPGAMVDRKDGQVDPYEGGFGTTIDADLDYYGAIVPFVDVTVSGTYTDATCAKVDAKASIEFLTDCEGYEIAYVLTGDGMTCPEGASTTLKNRWKQYNNYAGYTTTQAGFDTKTELGKKGALVCKGGKYGQSQIPDLTFNDVLIGSSWGTTHKNKAEALPTLSKAGEKLDHAYTVSITASSYGKSAIKYDQVNIVALVLDKISGEIVNAARAKVEYPEGIGTVLQETTDHGQQTAVDLSGRIATQAHGIVIQNGKKVIR